MRQQPPHNALMTMESHAPKTPDSKAESAVLQRIKIWHQAAVQFAKSIITSFASAGS
jgi:hypothetical protein